MGQPQCVSQNMLTWSVNILKMIKIAFNFFKQAPLIYYEIKVKKIYIILILA